MQKRQRPQGARTFILLLPESGMTRMLLTCLLPRRWRGVQNTQAGGRVKILCFNSNTYLTRDLFPAACFSGTGFGSSDFKCLVRLDFLYLNLPPDGARYPVSASITGDWSIDGRIANPVPRELGAEKTRQSAACSLSFTLFVVPL